MCHTNAPLEGETFQGANQTEQLFIHFLVFPWRPRSQSELLSAAGSLMISGDDGGSCLPFPFFPVLAFSFFLFLFPLSLLGKYCPTNKS